jgi:predicted metal-binding protein
MDCEVCGGTFKTVQRREDEKEDMVRYVYWCSCEGCGAGLVYYHPYVPKTDSTPIEDDESSNERRSE